MAEAREVFFARLDRGGSIRAVAAELGFSVDSCYWWRKEANLSTPRPKSRAYSAQDKAEFFRR
jgi:IS30 family transposase